jgi:hypothetical protein
MYSAAKDWVIQERNVCWTRISEQCGFLVNSQIKNLKKTAIESKKSSWTIKEEIKSINLKTSISTSSTSLEKLTN